MGFFSSGGEAEGARASRGCDQALAAGRGETTFFVYCLLFYYF